jgi:hypothetical protein
MVDNAVNRDQIKEKRIDKKEMGQIANGQKQCVRSHPNCTMVVAV